MDFHNSGSGGNILEHGEFVASEVIIEQLKTDIDSANVDEKLKPILHFIKKLTLTPEGITSKDAQYIFDDGWDEQAFLES